MTTEELRELDAWIAEHIMGWKNMMKHPICGFYGDSPTGSKSRCSVFSYSTDPAAALLVLEKCITEAPIEIQIDRKRSKDGPFRIECGVGATLKLAIADTLPLAICLFAKQLFSS